MSKTKVKYCYDCGKLTIHELVCKQHAIEDIPVIRVIWAIGSLGLSELVGKDSYYKCSRCGKLRKN